MSAYFTLSAKLVVRPLIYEALSDPKINKGNFSRLAYAMRKTYEYTPSNISTVLELAKSVNVTCNKGVVELSIVFDGIHYGSISDITNAIKGMSVGYILRIHNSNEDYWVNDVFEVSDGFNEILIKDDCTSYLPLGDDECEEIYGDGLYPVKTSCGLTINIGYTYGYFFSSNGQSEV